MAKVSEEYNLKLSKDFNFSLSGILFSNFHFLVNKRLIQIRFLSPSFEAVKKCNLEK